jgi:flavin reductase (DIM6/NTAB) family NADH-FMN oxidoreductase RutF
MRRYQLSPDVSEVDAAGLTREAARTVGVRLVVGVSVALECRLHPALHTVTCEWSSGSHMLLLILMFWTAATPTSICWNRSLG